MLAPVLLMTAKRSPASSLAVARILAATLPQAEMVAFDARFLERA